MKGGRLNKYTFRLGVIAIMVGAICYLSGQGVLNPEAATAMLYGLMGYSFGYVVNGVKNGQTKKKEGV